MIAIIPSMWTLTFWLKIVAILAILQLNVSQRHTFDIAKSPIGIQMKYLVASDYDCVTLTVGKVDTGEISCGCHVECIEEDYTVSLSTSLWPSTQYFVSFYCYVNK